MELQRRFSFLSSSRAACGFIDPFTSEPPFACHVFDRLPEQREKRLSGSRRKLKHRFEISFWVVLNFWLFLVLMYIVRSWHS